MGHDPVTFDELPQLGTPVRSQCRSLRPLLTHADLYADPLSPQAQLTAAVWRSGTRADGDPRGMLSAAFQKGHPINTTSL